MSVRQLSYYWVNGTDMLVYPVMTGVLGLLMSASARWVKRAEALEYEAEAAERERRRLAPKRRSPRKRKAPPEPTEQA